MMNISFLPPATSHAGRLAIVWSGMAALHETVRQCRGHLQRDRPHATARAQTTKATLTFRTYTISQRHKTTDRIVNVDQTSAPTKPNDPAPDILTVRVLAQSGDPPRRSFQLIRPGMSGFRDGNVLTVSPAVRRRFLGVKAG